MGTFGVSFSCMTTQVKMRWISSSSFVSYTSEVLFDCMFGSAIEVLLLNICVKKSYIIYGNLDQFSSPIQNFVRKNDFKTIVLQ